MAPWPSNTRVVLIQKIFNRFLTGFTWLNASRKSFSSVQDDGFMRKSPMRVRVPFALLFATGS